MGKGISVFLGMDYTLEENLRYMEFAKSYGFDRIFTSLHIPEADYSTVMKEFNLLINRAKELNMQVIADISPTGFKYLNLEPRDLQGIKELGIDVLRIDFGFSCEEIAEFTHNKCGIKIEINASTVTERFLNNFEIYKPNYYNIQACHNYYPRVNTGISVNSFNKKNEMLKKYGMKISAFVPSLVNKRGPIYEGLPTLEIHRNIKPFISAKHLYALGIDNVFFGDSIPTELEITEVGEVREDILEFNIELFTDCNTEKRIIFRDFHTNRSDSAEDVVRSSESRLSLIKDEKIEPYNNIERCRGHITIDNKNYLRYSGELQICKKNLSKDDRVNVVGKIVDEELFLLDFIEDETVFSFI